MRGPGRCVAALAVAMFVLSPAQAHAQTLYGITWGGPNQLITINTATGAGTVVGPLTTNMNPAGIAFRGSHLYTYDNIANVLRELDPATGATINTINLGIPAASNGEGDLDFRASDGIGFFMGFSPGPFFRFDLTVPNSTAIAPMTPTMDGLAFSPSGVLYGISEAAGSPGDDPTATLYTIDTTTGALTKIGATGLISGIGGLAFDPAGNLYASQNLASKLYKINPANGVATLIGPIGIGDVSGIRFPGVAGPPVAHPPGGGVGEGSFAGIDPHSHSPAGSEGAFGLLGGGQLVAFRSRPVLAGPFADLSNGPSHSRVFNVSYQQGAPANGQPQMGSSGGQAWSWVVFGGLALAVTSTLAKAISNLGGMSAASKGT